MKEMEKGGVTPVLGRELVRQRCKSRIPDLVATPGPGASVAPIPLDHPEISAWIRDCLKQNIDELHGGVFL